MVNTNNEIERIKNERITAQKARLIHQMLSRNKKAELLCIYSESSIFAYNQIANLVQKIQEEDGAMAQKILSGELPFSQVTLRRMNKRRKEMGGGYADTYRYITGLQDNTRKNIKERANFDVVEGKTNILMLNLFMWNNQVAEYLNEVNRVYLTTEAKTEFRSVVNKLQKNLKKVGRLINE